MNSKKNKMGSNKEMYRICPSKLTKHELEDLYFTVLEKNLQLTKTINEQQEKIKTLSNKIQSKESAKKLLQAEERKNCCVTTNVKVRQQKESIDRLRRAQDKAAHGIRKLNTQVCTANQSPRFLPQCARKTSSKRIKKTDTPSSLRMQSDTAFRGVQTEQINNKSFVPVETQTEFLRDETFPADTQTELLKNAISFLSVGTNTEMPSNESLSANTQTELPNLSRTDVETKTTQTENSWQRDYGIYFAQSQIELQNKETQSECNESLVSVENQTESMSKTPYKYHEDRNREQRFCNENKCRTLMDELKQKVNKLVEELAKTHKKYSGRISRLEFEVQEYRKENMKNLGRGHGVGEMYIEPSENYYNHLVNNLNASAGYTADLKLQLAKEKRKVAELTSQLRDAELGNKVTKGAPRQLVNGKEQKNKELNSEQGFWESNCDRHCPNTRCPFKNPKHITTRIEKYQCASICRSMTNTPTNSNVSITNSMSGIDSNKYQDLVKTTESQKLLTPCHREFLPNTKKKDDLLSQPNHICDGKNIKETIRAPSLDLNILEDSKTRDLIRTEPLIDNIQNYNTDDKKEIEYPFDATKMKIISETNGVTKASNKNLMNNGDMSDLNKLHTQSDVIRNYNVQNKDENDLQDSPINAFNRSSKSEGYTKGSPDTYVNRNVRLRLNIKNINQDNVYDINKVNDKVDDNIGQNYYDPHKQHFEPKEEELAVLSESDENREKASPSLMVKTDKNGTVLDNNLNTNSVSINSEQHDNKGPSRDSNTQIDNLRKPQQTGLDCHLEPDASKKGRSVHENINISKETMGLLRLMSVIAEKIDNGVIDTKITTEFHNSPINSKVETQKSSSELVVINHDEDNAQPQLIATVDKRYEDLDDNTCSIRDIHEESQDIIHSELNQNKSEGPSKITKIDLVSESIENVPTKDKIFEKKRDSVVDGMASNKCEQSTETTNKGEMSWTSMNNYLQASVDISKGSPSFDKNTMALNMNQKLDDPNDLNNVNSVSTPTQFEVATYRRDSGTLCFKTIPVSKRSHLCQCDEQIHCETVQNKGVQTGLEFKNMNKYTEHAASSTGNARGTHTHEAKNIYSNISDKSNVLDAAVNPTLLDNSFNQKSNLCTTSNKASTEYTKNRKERLPSITEELSRYKDLPQRNNILEAAMKRNVSERERTSEKILSEYDAECQNMLRRGMAKPLVNSPRCIFILHIGTVVLSDEAVLISRNKSLGLRWKFYDQDARTTQMRAGSVVVFDFSTEYDMSLTDEFLNYMKQDELQIIICQLEEPDKPIASCSLPLRDALLNANSRADVSLALVAAPPMIYARHVNSAVSDILDAGDEIGVLDLWCMLRTEEQFMYLIHDAIARDLKAIHYTRVSQTSDLKQNAKQMDNAERGPSKAEINKKSLQNNEFSDLLRWGSSALALQSRDASKQSVERNKDEISLGSLTDANIQRYGRWGSNLFHTPETEETAPEVAPRRKLSLPSRSGNKHKIRSKQTTSQTSPTTNSAVQCNDEFSDSMIINEVLANIRNADDMKRVINRSSLHRDNTDSNAEVGSYKKQASRSQQQIKTLSDYRQAPSPYQSQDLSNISCLNNSNTDRDDIDRARTYKKYESESQETTPEATLLLPTTGSKTVMADINRKYNNIAKLYANYNSQKKEGSRTDLSKKQVTINQKDSSTHHQVPKTDKPDEDEQTIAITILWLALNEESEVMLDSRVQRVYVAYEFLGRSGADLETPISLPKPKHYVDKCYFNFKKTFQLDKEDMIVLGEMAQCRAASQVPKSNRDCIVFSVISEPPEDPLGLDICEDIGYAYLYLGDLLAYSVDITGYTEVVPVRSRSGTSVCGVLAVRVDGLDVLRRGLKLVDPKISPHIE